MLNFTFLPQIIFEGVVIGGYSMVILLILFKIRRSLNNLSIKLALWQILYLLSMIIGYFSQINRRIFELSLFSLGITNVMKCCYLIMIPIANFIAYVYNIDFFNILFNRQRRIRNYFIFTIFVLCLSILFIIFPAYGYLGNIVVFFQSVSLFLQCTWRYADDFAKFEDHTEILREQKRIEQIQEELQTKDITALRYSLLNRAIVYLSFLIFTIFFLFDGIYDFVTGGY